MDIHSTYYTRETHYVIYLLYTDPNRQIEMNPSQEPLADYIHSHVAFSMEFTRYFICS
jgi:hypothetical protein